MKNILPVTGAILFALLLFSAFLLSGCAPGGELEQQNTELRASVDSLRRLNYECVVRNARLAEQVDSLKTAPLRSAGAERPVPVQQAAKPETPPAPPRSVPAGVAPPASLPFQSDYQEALHLFQTKEYAQSLARFRALAAAPVCDLTDNCEYWSGECNYAMEQYAAALDRFAAVLSFRDSDKRDDAMMMRGNSYLRLGDSAKARAEFQSLIDQYPDSEYAPRARAKLAALPPQ